MTNEIFFPDEKVILTKHFDVHQDWQVPIPSFLIIASIKKVNSIDEFSDDEAIEFIRLVREIRKGMREVLKIDNVYFFQREDSSHGFHLWVFPRYRWMERFGERIQSVRPILAYAKENMLGDDVFAEVKDYAKKMREYMSENWDDEF